MKQRDCLPSRLLVSDLACKITRLRRSSSRCRTTAARGCTRRRKNSSLCLASPYVNHYHASCTASSVPKLMTWHLPSAAIFFGRGLFNCESASLCSQQTSLISEKRIPIRRQHGTHAISASDRLSRSVAFFSSFLPVRTIMSGAYLPPLPDLFTVGRPISVKQKDHPTDAELDEVQARYIAELKRCVGCCPPPPFRACASSC